MNNAIQLVNKSEMKNFEYLGTVMHDGVQYIALLPLGSSSGRASLYICDADGIYTRIADRKTVLAVSKRFREAEIDAFDDSMKLKLVA